MSTLRMRKLRSKEDTLGHDRAETEGQVLPPEYKGLASMFFSYSGQGAEWSRQAGGAEGLRGGRAAAGGAVSED